VTSLNAPVPGAVARVAADLHPRLVAFDRIRERHTLVVKRFEDVAPSTLLARLRSDLAGTPAVEARLDGVGSFEAPPVGAAPVVYLAVDSPGLLDLHDRLVGAFGAVPGLEGPDYVPHVTLARGGDVADARRLAAEAEVPAVTWTVDRLDVFDPEYRETAGSVSLPVGR
jgi:2'-5' RNA ligase